MTVSFVYSVRSSCSECGESLVFAGPVLEVKCEACGSVLPFDERAWSGVLGFRQYAAQAGMAEGATKSSFISGSASFHVKWGPQRPLCSACGALLELGSVAPGFDGDVACSKCNAPNPTFPAPAWLREADPKAVQVFGAPRAGVVAAPQEKPKPVSFACPDCGANLKISADDQRVVTCQYCQGDVFLPASLWLALHPKRKRTPWYVTFSS